MDAAVVSPAAMYQKMIASVRIMTAGAGKWIQSRFLDVLLGAKSQL
jgi:hypothetical protein